MADPSDLVSIQAAGEVAGAAGPARTLPLGGDQVGRLAAALETAFTLDELHRLTMLGLGENLSLSLDTLVAVQGRNRRAICHDLVRWALVDERVGLHSLLAAALRTNPTNPDLLDLQAEWAGAIFVAPACPYPGMKPFTRAERARFYGRDAEIAQAIERLRRRPLLAVIGPSGSGKSSLLAAGILPALEKSHYFAGKRWDVRTMRPGAAPYDSLAALLGLGPLPGPQAEMIAGSPPASPAPAPAPTAPGLQLAEGTQLLLVVDQFEELYTVAARPQRERFEQALQHLLAEPDFYLIVAARADFYANLMASPLWPQIPPDHRLEITPPRGDALAAAIALPARDVGVALEPALVERLLADAGDEPGVLPFVQETLVMLWRHAGRLAIGLDDYTDLVGDKSGRSGLQVALAAHAQHVYQHVLDNDAERAAAQRTLLRLVQFGEGRPDTRRQQTVEQLATGGGEDAAFERVLAALTANRLVTMSDEARRVDLSHEALIRGWPLLHGWIEGRRAAELARRRLEEKAAERLRLRRQDESAGLLDTVELAEAEAWIRGPDAAELGASQELESLVLQSRAALDRLARAQAEDAQRDLDQARALAAEAEARRLAEERRANDKEQSEHKLRQRNQWLWVALVAALLTTAVAILFFFQARTEAQNARNAEVTAQASADEAGRQRTQAEASAFVARTAQAAAQAAARSAQAENLAALSNLELTQVDPNLLRALQYARSAVQWTLHTDGYVTSSADRALQNALNAYARDNEARRLGSEILSVDFNRNNGNVMLIGSSDHAARLIDLYDLSTIQEFAGHTKSVRSVQFSPDGKSAVTAGDDETIRLWDADTGEEIFIFFGHTGRVHSAAFSPDGGKIVSASGDGTVRLWDVASGRPLHQLAGHQGSVFSAGFGPDGSKVASGGFDGAVRVWDVATGRQLHTRQFDKSVGAVAFSPDGSAVAVGQGSRFDRDIDFKTYIWPILEAKEPITLTGHIRPVLSVAFSQDGSRLATVSDDGTARIWDAKTGKPLRVFDLAGYSLDDVAFDPADERLIAVGAAGSDGAIAMLEPDINELLTAARAAEYGLTKKMLEGLP